MQHGQDSTTIGSKRFNLRAVLSDPMHIAVHSLGITQITAWGTSYYFLGVLGRPMAADTGWDLSTVFLGFSIALIVMGFISSWVGRLIDQLGARTVMCTGTIIVSTGLLLISQTTHLYTYYAAWVVLGIGMRCCLYDAAFAAVVQVAPSRGRTAISYLTLYGAYASTVFWVIAHYLNVSFGWRETLMIFAAINLAVCLPLNWIGLTWRESAAQAAAPVAKPEPGAAVVLADPVLVGRQRTLGMILFALIMSMNGFVFGVVSLQLVPLLEAAGLATAMAVWVASLKGHGQFAGRLVEIVFGRNLKAMTIARISIGVLPVALIILQLSHSQFWLLVAFTMLMGASQGVITIVRGAVPLALFGPQGYGTVLGYIATPILFVNAFSPTVFALITDWIGWTNAIYVLMASSALTFLAMEMMSRWYERAKHRGAAETA